MSTRFSSPIAVTGIFLLLSSANLRAEPVPDAGSILRQQVPQRRELPDILPEHPDDNGQDVQEDPGMKLMVKGFSFSGFEGVVEESQLQEVVARAIGENLGYRDLRELADKVSAYLRENGWFLSKAYLPRQDVTSGTVEIRIVTSRSDGGARINREQSVRVRDCVLRSMTGKAVGPDKPINEQLLERSLLHVNDLPGITARAALAPGTKPGSSRIDINVAEGPLVSASVWGDNYGNRYTGAWRANGIASVNDPFGYADQLTLLVTGSERLAQGRVAYSFPICYGGVRGNISYTGMRYKLGEELASNNFEGSSNGVDAGVSFAASRGPSSNVNLSATYGYRELKDSASGAPNNDKRLGSLSLAANGERYDRFSGGGLTTWNIGLTMGNFHGSGEVSSATAAANCTEGEFSRLNLGLARLQRITGPVSASLSWTAQFTQQNLDSSEKFSLGGHSGVRAYPVGEAMGDHGHLLNASLRYALPLPAGWGACQLEGFYDAGRITLQDNPTANPGTATGLNTYWLQGAGIGLNHSLSGRLSIKASWAHTIGDNPGRSALGNNSDGRADTSRYWLQALFTF
ncbi:MAG: ShlB/FhaC/HecB family hemolysin secretion/activation protein [Chlorobiaceae bacterium]|nr:ShlB/FhaC/HecB family hemolysin secretion/activation protein [Chlorobiaceae bacterium]